MLGKLFKYEWKAASPLLLVVHGFMLIFAVFSRIMFSLNGGLIPALNTETNDVLQIIALVLLFFMIMIIGSVAFFTYVYAAYRFYKNVFTDQGYLTNTLPVTPVQIILSKGLVGILWIVIDMVILCITCMILFAEREFFHSLGEGIAYLFDYIGDAPAYFWLTLFAMILSPFIMVIQEYFCVSVGSLFSGHKVLGAIGTYIGIYIIQQICALLIMVFTGYRIFLFNTASALSTINRTLSQALIFSLIFSIACMVAFWFGTKHIMTRKLNLQ